MEKLTQPAMTTAFETFFKGCTRGESLLCVTRIVDDEDLLTSSKDQLCQVALGDDTEVVSFYSPYCSDPFASKVRVRSLRAVFHAEHPAEHLLDNDEDGDLTPEEAWAEGEAMINDYVEEAIREELGLEAEVISKESISYSCYGGRYVELRLKQPVSVAFSESGPVVRPIAA